MQNISTKVKLSLFTSVHQIKQYTSSMYVSCSLFFGVLSLCSRPIIIRIITVYWITLLVLLHEIWAWSPLIKYLNSVDQVFSRSSLVRRLCHFTHLSTHLPVWIFIYTYQRPNWNRNWNRIGILSNLWYRINKIIYIFDLGFFVLFSILITYTLFFVAESWEKYENDHLGLFHNVHFWIFVI